MAYKLIGKNFMPHDVRAKVTGAAKYAEDFRADGMVFAKMLLSPMPHARVRNLDISAAAALPGVVGILTADDLPPGQAPGQPALTNEPVFVGDPILAVIAESETIAADAIERIRIEYEPLPFTIDPLESLYPGGPNAIDVGNVGNLAFQPTTIKWTARDFAAASDGQLPQGQPAREWSYGDLDAKFGEAKLVLDESFVTAGMPHNSMEPRSCMAYWEGGKCFVYGSIQSQSFAAPPLARMLGIELKDLVFISENCGGGFGSKGSAYPLMMIPAYAARKVSRPVMLRVSRAEEYFLGYSRHGFQGRIKLGFAENGRILAADIYIVQENGPYAGFPDWTGAAEAVSLVYQPESMRWRGIPVFANTPPKSAQRGPGQNQIAVALEPLMDKAAKSLGIDRVALRRLNAPDNDGAIGENREPLTSAYLKEALDIGKREFDWDNRIQRSGQRRGSKVTGIGVGQAFHPAGSNGFDGLVCITPDGKLHIHTGIGNLGTYSHSGTSRVAAEILGYDWDNCVVERGDSRKNLPWNLGQFGSNTSYTMTRTNYVAATDALNKLKEIAAMDLGGSPDDYDIADEKVVARADNSKSMTYAQAAQRAIELGGKFDGHEVAEDLNPMTAASVAAIAGTGLIGAAKDNLPQHGLVPALAAGFMEIELDIETGKYEIKDYVGVADCGTVIHPQGLDTQIKGGAIMGIGQAGLERHVYDPQNGLPANVGLYQVKPPSYMDMPTNMRSAWVDQPDRQNPVGTKGIGEPVMGCAAGALLSAISDALGGHYFNRVPVTPDQIVNAAAGREQSHKPLQTNCV
ncbi:MAG: xanthine dehydrogenase family protein molybdopterin-binding subunit [Gammaproteobacteria bacterium]|nr:xanthine dehydrogenase family protein molybdopterin-binding subunit [Gammaproteobacteria bacterium]